MGYRLAEIPQNRCEALSKRAEWGNLLGASVGRFEIYGDWFKSLSPDGTWLDLYTGWCYIFASKRDRINLDEMDAR